MLKIPRQQVLERWDVLPDNLKEALFSESNSGIVWQIGTLNHLSEEKISMMATIVGDVIFGFLHSDDLARGIQESLNLNSQIANSISHEINRKIFAPIKIDLEKIYSPVSAMPFNATQSRPEIKPPDKSETKINSGKESAPKPSGIKPEAELRPAVLPTTAEAQKAPTTKPEIPVIPIAPIVPTPIIPTAAVPAEKSFDKTPDKPFILHQETEARPVGEKQRISSPATNWFQKAMPTSRQVASAVRQEKPRAPVSPVKIELEVFGQKSEGPSGKTQGSSFGAAQSEKKEPISAKTEAPRQRIVHYRETEISNPFGKPFGAAQGRPEPPKPMTPTTPIAKPAESKIINLDYFETIKENKEQNEVKLEGNTINLKNNNK